MSTLISIDFDFLIYHGMYEKKILLPAVNDTAPGMFVYDWQMSESRAPDFDTALWYTRMAQFKLWGLDLDELFKPRPDVVTFAQEISARLNGNTIPGYRADSHAWMGIVARDYAKQYGPLTVVNFDAHHDLGYGDHPLYQFQKDSSISCDNWALIGLHEGWIGNFIQVYPDWLGLKEWKYLPIEVRKRKFVRGMTWSEWLAEGEQFDSPEAAFFCRSSAWIPPFLDGEFQKLVEEWEYTECLDCHYGQTGSPYHVCEQREWDWEELDRQVEFRKAADAMVREMNARAKNG